MRMHPGDGLHGLGDVKFSAILHKIRIAYSDLGIHVVEQYLRLGPVDVSILFDSPGDPRRISVGIVIPWPGKYAFAAVVVIPEQVLSVAEFLDEIRSARMLDLLPVRRSTWHKPAVSMYGRRRGCRRAQLWPSIVR